MPGKNTFKANVGKGYAKPAKGETAKAGTKKHPGKLGRIMPSVSDATGLFGKTKPAQASEYNPY